MAWAEVGGGTQRATGRNAGGTLDIAYPANVAAGNLLLVMGSAESGVSAITVTKSDATNAFTVVLGTGTGLVDSMRPWIAYRLAASSEAFTVRITSTGGAFGGYKSAAIDEFSGAHATVADVNGGTSTGTSTTPSDGITTVADDALIGGSCAPDWSSNITITASSMTSIGEEEDATNWAIYNAAFKIVSGAGANTVDWTLGASREWAAQSHSFAPAAVGGGGTVIPVLQRAYRSRRVM